MRISTKATIWEDMIIDDKHEKLIIHYLKGVKKLDYNHLINFLEDNNIKREYILAEDTFESLLGKEDYSIDVYSARKGELLFTDNKE